MLPTPRQLDAYKIPQGYEEFTTGYIARGIYSVDLVAQRAHKELEHVEFDTLVGTGLSGALVVPRLADLLFVEWAIVRKADDTTHSWTSIEGRIGSNWLFVDDLIDSGQSLYRTQRIVKAECARAGHSTEYAGAWYYSWTHLGYQPPGSEYIEPDAVRAVNEEFGEDED